MSSSFVVKDAESYASGDVIIPHSAIMKRVTEVAEAIARDCKGKDVAVIGLLNGAYSVTTDLLQALYAAGQRDLILDFLKVRSYASGTTATNEPHIVSDVSISLKEKTVLVVDDIIDTGKSLQFVNHYLKDKGAKEIFFFTLLDKPSRRKVPFTPTYVGFTIPDIWVQGYGMDTDEKGRGSADIIKGPYFS